MQTVAHSRQQNILLKFNPHLIQTAAPGVDHEHVGWSELKKNNISEEIAEKENIVPLMHNKVDVIDTANLSLEQLYDLLEHILAELQTLSAILTEPGCTTDRRAIVCSRIADLCSYIEQVRAHIGERNGSGSAHSQPKL